MRYINKDLVCFIIIDLKATSIILKWGLHSKVGKKIDECDRKSSHQEALVQR